MKQNHVILRATECGILFILIPVLAYLYPARGHVALFLWVSTAYGAFILHRSPGFSWRREWGGEAWSRRVAQIVLLRSLLAVGVVFAMTYSIDPLLLFSFPKDKPQVWAMVMLLYPLLSALPQEFVFRTFFFERYKDFFPAGWGMIVASATTFAFSHIVFHNAITPALTFIFGLFLGWSYVRHRSLGKVTLEHAFYGDMVFTVGLGVYFVLRHN